MVENGEKCGKTMTNYEKQWENGENRENSEKIGEKQ